MKISNLNKNYGEFRALNDINLEIPKGKITAFIGPNGAGKSTLMHAISRLIKFDSGSVEINGKNLNEWKSGDLAKHLAILTQSNNTNMKLSVRELVNFGRFPYSAAKLTNEYKKIVSKAIEKMELSDLADCYLDELSGGQRQRAYIAMIIAQDTEFVLLDEPTNNLDIYHSISMMKNAGILSKELNKTVIMVLHELNLAAFYSDFIVAMKDGKIVKFGTPSEIMTAENLKEIYGVEFEILQIHGKPMSVYF